MDLIIGNRELLRIFGYDGDLMKWFEGSYLGGGFSYEVCRSEIMVICIVMWIVRIECNRNIKEIIWVWNWLGLGYIRFVGIYDVKIYDWFWFWV